MIRTSRLLPLIFFIALLCALSAPKSQADESERWFQTEIIIFEIRANNGSDSEGEELWPDDPGLPDYEASIELTPAIDIAATNDDEALDAQIPETKGTNGNATTTEVLISNTEQRQEQPFQQLPEEALTLTEIATKLENSANYVPILHLAWRQPVAAKEAAQAIYIHSNLEEGSLTASPGLTNINSLIAPPALTTAPLLLSTQSETGDTSETRVLNTLEGTIKLHLGRYLHLEADLLYRNQTEPLENNTFFMTLDEGEQLQTLFRMHQKRRMRSGELHYFDHPMLGLLAKITPYELPEIVIEPAPLLTTEDNSAPSTAGHSTEAPR